MGRREARDTRIAGRGDSATGIAIGIMVLIAFVVSSYFLVVHLQYDGAQADPGALSGTIAPAVGSHD